MTMKGNRPLARLRYLLANVQVNVTLANYSKVTPKWRNLNFVPEFNRFYFIREGTGCLEIDGTAYYPRPGQLFVMPAGVKQSYYALDEDNFGKYWCHFTAKIGDTELFRLLGPPYFIDVSDVGLLTGLFERLLAHSESGDFTAVLLQKAALLEIVSLYLESAVLERQSFAAVDEDRGMRNINVVLKYIETHLHENVTIQQLADLVHFHPNYLIRQFRERVGVTPIQYAQKLKLETAKTLLTATDEPVSGVARSLGMELYYFSRLFKKHTGFSPSEYRQLML